MVECFETFASLRLQVAIFILERSHRRPLVKPVVSWDIVVDRTLLDGPSHSEVFGNVLTLALDLGLRLRLFNKLGDVTIWITIRGHARFLVSIDGFLLTGIIIFINRNISG